MTSIGNDIVDLTDPDNIGKSRDRRFIARVFTPEEQVRIDRSESPDTTLWMFWAAKEAAFKAISKSRPGLSFIHRAYVVTLPLNEDSRKADVSHPSVYGHFFSTEERPLNNASFCHSGLDPEASNDMKILDSGFRRNDDGETKMEFLKGLEENSLCSGCRREAAHPNESGKAAHILLQQTNGDTVPIQECGVVMTPAGPVDAFFTLSSSHRVHCVAAAKNGHGGASAATAVQVREERRDGPFDPSAAVRRAVIHHLASALKASPYYIDIRRDKTAHGYGAPRVFIQGSRTDIDISFSHDGRYIAFAVHF